MEQLITTLQDAAIAVACSAITALAAYAVSYLYKLRKKAQAETEKIEDEHSQEFINNILDRAYDTLSICIDKMEVTIVKSLKETNEDGKLTEEDGKKVAEDAINLFYEIVDQDVSQGLELIVKDAKQYLLTLVDSMVLEKKTELLKSGVNPGVTTGSVPTEQALLNS